MKQNSDTAVKSATRAVDILEFVAAARTPPMFSDIAEDLEIPNSSLFYLLNTLKARGYLDCSERGSYSIGAAVQALAERGLLSRAWRQLIPSLLDQITGAINETSTFGEQRGDEVECVDVRLASQTLLPVLHAGQRAPLYTFSGGKIFLANMADAEIDSYISRSDFKRFTPKTITTGKALWREIAEIRASGIAYSRDEHTLGVTGLSVPLRTADRLVGTVGVAVPTVRFNRNTHADICRQLEDAAQKFALGRVDDEAVTIAGRGTSKKADRQSAR